MVSLAWKKPSQQSTKWLRLVLKCQDSQSSKPQTMLSTDRDQKKLVIHHSLVGVYGLMLNLVRWPPGPVLGKLQIAFNAIALRKDTGPSTAGQIVRCSDLVVIPCVSATMNCCTLERMNPPLLCGLFEDAGERLSNCWDESTYLNCGCRADARRHILAQQRSCPATC